MLQDPPASPTPYLVLKMTWKGQEMCEDTQFHSLLEPELNCALSVTH